MFHPNKINYWSEMDLEKQETKEKAVAQGFTDELKGTSYCWSASQSPRMVIAIRKKIRIHILETSLWSTLSTESLLHMKKKKKEHVRLQGKNSNRITFESISCHTGHAGHRHRGRSINTQEDHKSLSPRKFPEINTEAKLDDGEALKLQMQWPRWMRQTLLNEMNILQKSMARAEDLLAWNGKLIF